MNYVLIQICIRLHPSMCGTEYATTWKDKFKAIENIVVIGENSTELLLKGSSLEEVFSVRDTGVMLEYILQPISKEIVCV